MKKLIYLLPIFLIFFACQKDEIPVPTSLLFEKETLLFNLEEETQSLNFTTTGINYSVEVNESSKEWCEAIIEGKALKVTVKKNAGVVARKATLTVRVDKRVATIAVTQQSENFEVINDTKLLIASAKASSEETENEETGVKKSFDGDMSTIWHTQWGANTLPHDVTYTLKDADQLDYILYHPRSNAGNGTFGVIDVYVSTEAKPELTLTVADFDCGKSGGAKKIVFATPIEKPKDVKFIIKSSVGNFASCAEMEFYKGNPDVVANYIDIPMNKAGYVEPDQYAGYVGGTMRLPYNADIKVQGKVFFKYTQSGNSRLQLKVNNATADKKIKVTFADYTAEINLPKTTSFEWITLTTQLFEGSVNYQSMVIENLNEGEIQIEALRIIGEAHKGVSFNDNKDEARRNAVSVHLGYPIDGLANVEWFYNEMTIPEGFDKPYHSYYMANGWSLGYSGLQTRDLSGANSKRWLLFSCWNSKETDDVNYWAKVTKKGTNVQSSSFGGEGTGAKTWLELDWKAGKTYCFLLRARVSATSQNTMNDTTYYSMFWKEKGAADWTYQATIMSPYNGKYLSGLYSFVENFIGSDGQYQRKALYHNQWVKANTGWVQLAKASFTSDGSIKYRSDVGAGVDDNGYFLWNGGFIVNQGWPGDKLTRNNSTSAQPVSEAEMLNLDNMTK